MDKKNIIIGLLVIVIVILGYVVFVRSQPPKLQVPSPSPTVGQNVTPTPKSTPAGNIITPQESWNKIGEVATVEYFVGNPFQSSKGNVFLNEKREFKSGFTTTIFANSVNKFGNPISMYGSKTIRVTGLIKMYEGHPEIIADDPSRIEVVK